jgi:RNA recognition motif-containing protein
VTTQHQLNVHTIHTNPNRPTINHHQVKMASTVEKVADVASDAVNDVTNALSNTSLTGKDENKDAAVHASAAEGRRLYIGNLAYATTEGELKEFFKGYLV